jgi:hypothetical protein
MVELLAQAARIRRQYLEVLTQPRRCSRPTVSAQIDALLALSWRLPRGQALLIVANVDFARSHRCVIRLPRRSSTGVELLLGISPQPKQPRSTQAGLSFHLTPGDVRIMRV